MRTLILSTLAALALGSVATPAVAQTAPDFCDTPREVRFFNLGVRKGRNAAQQAIAAVQDDPPECPTLERVQELEATLREIADRLDVPPESSDAVQCHVIGQAAGLVAEIVDFQDDCFGFCIADGQFVGEVSAHLYCELSIALGGLGLADLFERLATDTCGTEFQNACDDAFEATAIDFPECAEFTIAPFEDVFALTQNNQCAANPGPDP